MHFEPIGIVHSPLKDKADAPRQPRAAEGVQGHIELFRGHNYEDAVCDLEQWGALWILFVFDRAVGWRPKVRPPRSDGKRGVFGTRAPHRPNPIGMSAVRLERVEGLKVFVRDIDILDQTPVLDIKPYVPWADALPEAESGWLERPADPGPRFSVSFEPEAEAAFAFLADGGTDLQRRVEDHLSIGPRPHAYRRIRADGDGFVLAVKSWRVRFLIEGQHVRVLAVRCGEKRKKLTPLQQAFVERFEQC